MKASLTRLVLNSVAVAGFVVSMTGLAVAFFVGLIGTLGAMQTTKPPPVSSVMVDVLRETLRDSSDTVIVAVVTAVLWIVLRATRPATA